MSVYNFDRGPHYRMMIVDDVVQDGKIINEMDGSAFKCITPNPPTDASRQIFYMRMVTNRTGIRKSLTIHIIDSYHVLQLKENGFF